MKPRLPDEWLDLVVTAIQIQWGINHEIKIRAAWVWYDNGMDPLVVVVYDERFTDDAKWNRRFAYTQGIRRGGDYILDWEEGW